ncbi:MAG: tetratricopeptide repeat protein [Sphingobacteriales bacterium]|jgi:tetratricopeptide (TPR) repeat protein
MGSAEQTFQKAVAALNGGDVLAAESLFRAFLQSHPQHVAALNLLTVVLVSMGRYQEAEEFISRAVKLNNLSDVSFYNYGTILKHLNKPKQALERFDRALQLNANAAETWNNRGTVFNALNEYASAIADFDRAILLNPNYSEAFCNKGKSLIELGCFDEAIASYDRALSIKPSLTEAWLGRANALTELGRYDEASVACDKALALMPNLAAAWLGRGNVLIKRRCHSEALGAYQKALALDPGLAEAWLGRGNALVDLKNYNDALSAFDKALALKPNLAGAWLGRGNAFIEIDQGEHALAAYDKAITLRPDLAEAMLGRGNVLAESRRFGPALTAYDEALALRPDMAGIWAARGNVLTELKRYEDAFAAYDKAIALDPHLAKAWVGRGNLFVDLNQFDGAFAAYARAEELEPDLADAYWNEALARLCVGSFAQGWDLYEWRGKLKDNKLFQIQSELRQVSIRQPRDALMGKAIAIFPEQGVGDEIMFASILPDLIMDAKSVSYEVDRRLVRLFENAFPTVKVAPRGNRDYLDEAQADLVLQAGSLGYAYRGDRSSFPGAPYLTAESFQIDKWKTILAREGGLRPKIGISWRGGTDKTRRQDRSLDLNELSSLIQGGDYYFVSLQYGDVSEEIAEVNSTRTANPVHRLLDDFNDFDEFAALITALDLVISVQNTTIHMCGALGRPCWGLIPWRPEWRYGNQGKSMVWYQCVSLYRQKSPGDWKSALGLVKSDLANLVRA